MHPRHKYWNGRRWSDWESLGGILESIPAVVSHASDRIDVYAKGTDSALWHLEWTGSQWKAWESIGGVIQSPPAVASWGKDRIDVFALGTDHALWHNW